MRFLKRIGDIVKSQFKPEQTEQTERTDECLEQAYINNPTLKMRQPTSAEELHDSNALATQENLERMKTLTPREWEVYEYLIHGLKMREIAQLLGVTYPTVNFHCQGLYKKLCVNTRVQLFMQYSTLDVGDLKKSRGKKI